MRIMFLSQSPEGPGEKASHDRTEALLNSYASPGTTIELRYPDDSPGARVYVAMGGQTVLTGLHHAMLTPALIKKIFWAQEQGYDAVIQSNTFDPGVETGRLAVRIPVIGLFRTGIHSASILADRIGLTVPLAGHVPYSWRILRTYGMQDFVCDIQPIGIYGDDLQTRKGELLGRTVEIMQGLVKNSGAELILPLGGALFPYTVDPADLEKEVGVPVLNTKAVGIRFAEMCVNFGLSHSPTTYPGAKLNYQDFGSMAYSG